MTAMEFLRRLKRVADAQGVALRTEPRAGSHHALYLGARRTILAIHKGREIPTGTLRAMLRDLGLAPKDIEE